MEKETKWSIDQAHTEIDFKIRHLIISHVEGVFNTFDASIYTTGNNFTTAEIDLWIDASSLDTGNAKRDEHLKGVDFFDVQKHKQITFKSSTIGPSDRDGYHELWGDLTMNGITKKIMLNVEFGGVVHDPSGNEKAGFAIAGKINRSDWELVWNSTLETGGIVVGDEVTISCQMQLINIGQDYLTIELESVRDKQDIL